MSDLIERIKKRIEKERAYDETAWETLANKGNKEHQVVYSSRNSVYNIILKAIDEEFAKEPQECEWIHYDYRTIVPKYHDINNPYWRIPENMNKLKYCPYCGRKIKVVE